MVGRAVSFISRLPPFNLQHFPILLPPLLYAFLLPHVFVGFTSISLNLLPIACPRPSSCPPALPLPAKPHTSPASFHEHSLASCIRCLTCPRLPLNSPKHESLHQCCGPVFTPPLLISLPPPPRGFLPSIFPIPLVSPTPRPPLPTASVLSSGLSPPFSSSSLIPFPADPSTSYRTLPHIHLPLSFSSLCH